MSVFSLTTMRTFMPFDLSVYPHILRYLGRVGERKAYRYAMTKGDRGCTPMLGGPAPKLLPAMKLSTEVKKLRESANQEKLKYI
jgi:glutathione S-transferase